MINNSNENLIFLNKEKTAFRPIHYLGSKLRVLEAISDVIDEIDPTFGRVYDIFSGSGTVSSYLGRKRPVTSVDIQEYSRVLTSAVLQPFSEEEFLVIKEKLNELKETDLEICMRDLIDYEETALINSIDSGVDDIYELIEYGSMLAFLNGERDNISVDLKTILKKTIKNLNEFNLMNLQKSITVRYFGGTYFSFKQASALDNLLDLADYFEGRLKDIVLAAVLSTASTVVNTVGKQFAQPLKTFDSDGKPKTTLIKKISKDRNLDVYKIFNEELFKYFTLIKGNFDHVALCGDYKKALENLTDDTKVVYADPPYTRYHYSRYYHVLETMSLRDSPEITKVKVNGELKMSRGLYRKDRHQSPFSTKTKANEAFETLFNKVSEKNISLILSYSPYSNEQNSTPRVQKISELLNLARKYFLDVEVISIEGITHSKFNSIDKNFDIPQDAEILIVCK